MSNWSLDPIRDWLLAKGRLADTMDDMTKGLAEQMIAVGAPVWRVRLAIRTLHPLITAMSVAWERDDGLIPSPDAAHGLESRPAYIASPLAVIAETGQPFRRRLDRALAPEDHIVLHELKERGATDYYGLPLEFRNGAGGIVVFVTDHAGGFESDDLERLRHVAALITPVVEVFRLDHSATAITDAYLGPRTAKRVLSGQITRGHIETIQAAILVSDMRGWTALNAELAPDDIVCIANRYFEILGDAIASHDGEILKLMGDGLLAIFPGEDMGQASDNALSAALTAQSTARADPPLGVAFGIAMHVGDVLYGNVGSEARLDFTVLGPAVNLAARLEGLCAKYGQEILFSEPFAHALGTATRKLGSEPLKGLTAPQAVYSLLDG